MKNGDTVPVTIAGDVVAQAKVTEVDKDNSTVTLVIPPTKVVMGLRVELDTAPPEVEESGPGVVITGVDRYDDDGTIVSSTSEAAPVGETPDHPEGEATQEALVEPPVADEQN